GGRRQSVSSRSDRGGGHRRSVADRWARQLSVHLRRRDLSHRPQSDAADSRYAEGSPIRGVRPRDHRGNAGFGGPDHQGGGACAPFPTKTESTERASDLTFPDRSERRSKQSGGTRMNNEPMAEMPVWRRT